MTHECARDETPALGFSCRYGHLKAKAMNGGRDRLSPDELEFVGVTSRRREVPGGWRQPNTAPHELDSILSAEDAELLQSLMSVGTSQERLEFLG